ncbi:MAG TPA: proton-conducting transporter membrane subunit [bacterium]
MRFPDAQLPVLIAIVPLLAAFVLPLIGRARPRAAYPFTVAVLGVSASSALVGLAAVAVDGPIHYAFGGWAPPLGIAWRLDGLSAFVSVALSVSLLVILIGVHENAEAEFGQHPVAFHTLLLLLGSGMLGLVLSADLFNVFVFLEVFSISAYALIGSGAKRGTVAAYRYLLFGTVGATLYLFGVGLLYAMTGTLNMDDAAARLAPLAGSRVVLGAVILLVTGLAIKAAIVPLHGWLPDAYAYAPNAVSAVIAPLMTKVALYALIRILGWVAGMWWSADAVVMAILRLAAVAAIVLGPLAARLQTDFRRLLAYSSIGQIGLIVLGISFASELGLTGALLHLVNDICAKAVLFLTACVITLRMRVSQVSALSRLKEPMGWFWVMFVIASLSMVGIPPTLGFFSKWYLILAALEASRWPLAALVVASALLSAWYVFVLVELLFRRPDAPAAKPDEVLHVPWRMTFATGVFAIGLIALGLANQPIARLIGRIAMPPGAP